MNPVGLVERGIAGHAFEQKRNQPDVVALGQRRDTPRETAPCSRRRSSAALPCRRESPQSPRFLPVLDDRGQIRFELFRRQAAQPVVAAERDDENLRIALAQRPLEPPQPAGRGVARHAGIDHLDSVGPAASSRF